MGNTLKTTALLAGLTGLLLFAGGMYGGQQGMVMALVFAGLMNLVGYWYSDKIVLAMYRAREVSPQEAPELHSIVDGLVARGGMPKPKVYVIPTEQPNAFATGRNPSHAAVAATNGILRLLNRSELEAVMAHELAHVRNRDILISTLAATIAGAIGMLASWARWAAIFGGMGGRDRDEEGGAGMVQFLVLVILVPIMAMLIQLMVSRSREYGADAGGAEISGNPLALASALRKLERGAEVVPMDAPPATAHMFIVNPLSRGMLRSLLSTHPSVEDRVARLEAMAGQFGPRQAPEDRYYYSG